MKVGLITFFLLIFIQEKTQQKIDFQFAFNANAITLNKTIPFLADSITFSKIAVYLSSPEINFYQLVNAENDKSLQLDFEEIGSNTFYLGVDSLTNSNGAMGGDLDPTKGMYWTWQSGYINVKIEGKYSGCNTRNNKFQFHLGGYQNPFQTIQKIESFKMRYPRAGVSERKSSTCSALVGRTRRATSLPSSNSINVGHSFTLNERPKRCPLPSSTLI